MSWYDQVLPLARRASALTGLPVSAILAQWAEETGRGSSSLAASNNLAGIKYTGAPGSHPGDGAAVYDSLNSFVVDYARVINLSFYDNVRAAAASGGPEAAIRAFTSSPPGVPRYAENPAYSTNILAILRGDNLTRYDQAGQAGQVAATQTDGGIHLTPVGGSLPANLSAGALAAIAAVAGTILLLVISGD